MEAWVPWVMEGILVVDVEIDVDVDGVGPDPWFRTCGLGFSTLHLTYYKLFVLLFSPINKPTQDHRPRNAEWPIWYLWHSHCLPHDKQRLEYLR